MIKKSLMFFGLVIILYTCKTHQLQPLYKSGDSMTRKITTKIKMIDSDSSIIYINYYINFTTKDTVNTDTTKIIK